MDVFAAGFGIALKVAARGAAVALAAVCVIAGASAWAQTDGSGPIRGLSRKVTFVKENGNFQHTWPTLEAARAAAAGDSINGTLRNNPEILALASRCEGKVAYSLYMLDPEIRPLAAELAALKAAYTETSEATRTKVNAMKDIMDRAGYGKSGPCDYIPVELVQTDGTVIPLERNDTGHPLIGARYNDAYIFEATAPDRPGQMPSDPRFKAGVVNGFTSNGEAIAVALRLSGTKVAVIAGGKMYLYRATPQLLYMSAEAKVRGLNASPPNKDFAIVGVIDGHGAVGKAYAIPQN